MKHRSILTTTIFAIVQFALLAAPTFTQTTAFSYQGQMPGESGLPPGESGLPPDERKGSAFPAFAPKEIWRLSLQSFFYKPPR